MSLSSWSRNWFRAVIICLTIITGCSIGLFMYIDTGDSASDPKYVINQVRITVNPIMLYLEQHADKLDDAGVREQLDTLTQANNVEMMYTNPAGTVSFQTAGLPPIQKIDLHTDLHYDMHSALQAGEYFEIAFPVISGTPPTQIGNAIFTVPENIILEQNTNTIPLLLFLAAILLSLSLVVLFNLIKRKMELHLISPVQTLKQHAEAILKGNYEQQIQYARMDELDELFGMFDLMREEIKHLNIQRIKQEQAQKELISNISHDLKTPITTVKAYIDAILEGICPDPETMLEYVEVMRTNTDKIARLVDDLLIHALQELGQISVDPREQYSQELLQHMLKPIGHYVRSNGLVYVEPEDIPNVLINIDTVRIEQVISNLVSNALKHTAPGDTIMIKAELETGHLKITIADTGKGIRPQDMPFIFERYFKGQASTAYREHALEGSGLGLSICKTIIEAHGGQISFTSKEGQGTTFHFTLPNC